MTTAKRLTRSKSDKLIGGVCGGLGEYFDLDPTLIRLAFALLIIFGVGSPILFYVLLWIIMPAGPKKPMLIEADEVTPTESTSESTSEMSVNPTSVNPTKVS